MAEFWDGVRLGAASLLQSIGRPVLGMISGWDRGRERVKRRALAYTPSFGGQIGRVKVVGTRLEMSEMLRESLC